MTRHGSNCQCKRVKMRAVPCRAGLARSAIGKRARAGWPGTARFGTALFVSVNKKYAVQSGLNRARLFSLSYSHCYGDHDFAKSRSNNNNSESVRKVKHQKREAPQSGHYALRAFSIIAACLLLLIITYSSDKSCTG